MCAPKANNAGSSLRTHGDKEKCGLATEQQLSERWGVSIKKLQADRLKGEGIPFVKIGRLVRYRLEDILAYEQANLRNSTSEG